MSKAARSVFLFSIYLMAVGILLVLVPNLLLRIFLLPQTDEVWIRSSRTTAFKFLHSDLHNLVVISDTSLIGFKRQSEDDWVVGIWTADAGQWLLAPRKSSAEPQSGDEWHYCIECPCAHALRTKSIRYDPGVSDLESRGALSATHDFDDLHSYRSPDFIRHFTSSVCLYRQVRTFFS